MDKQEKASIIDKYKMQDGDTGSTEIQIAMLTEKISQLTTHLAANSHDFNTKRSLLKLVGQRRRLLVYLNRQGVSRYKKLIKSLGLRK